MSIVHQANVYEVLRAHQQALDTLLRGDGSDRWITVGDVSDPEAPPFQNGWAQVADAYHDFQFKRWLNWTVFRGSCAGGPDFSVICTLPQPFWPTAVCSMPPGRNQSGGLFTFVVNPNGDVLYETSGAL